MGSDNLHESTLAGLVGRSPVPIRRKLDEVAFESGPPKSIEDF